jgi:3-hydroxyacyl-CoA dehydrogenase
MATKNRLAIVGLAAGLLGGGAAGIALTTPGVAQGQASTTTTTTKDSTSSKAANEGRESFLQRTLAPLVKKGTITQAQADAVIKAIDDAQPSRAFGGHGPGRAGELRGAFGDVFGAAAKKLGISTDALRSALRSGKSIADVAKEKKVAPAAVVDAIVAAIKADLDQAVKDGKLTKAQADRHLTEVRSRITALVNGQGPRFGGRWGGGAKPNVPGIEKDSYAA